MTTDPPRDRPAVVPGAVHRVSVAGRDDRGRGRAALGRRELRIPQALPGETLDVRLAHVGRHVAMGRIEGVVRGSPDRVPDACPHGAVCPGCGLRTTSGAARQAFLRERVVRALAAAGLRDAPVAGAVAAAAEDGWRHKAYLTARQTRHGLRLGLYEEHSHRLLGIEGCLAHAPAVERALDAARTVLRRRSPSTYDERTGRGWLRYVLVRASAATGEALLTLVATGADLELAASLAHDLGRRDPGLLGVVLNVHSAPGNAPLGAEFHLLEGQPWIEERAGAHPLRVSAGSFFQVNPVMGARIQDDAAALARGAPAGLALDLYAGVGATAVRLAADGRDVLLVDQAGPSVEDARENVARVGPGRVEVRAGRVEDEIRDALARRPSVVLVNPPRSGLAKPVADALAAASPPRILYTACDPGALARDLAILSGAGYRLESVTPYDLMPQTPHVEALAALARPT